MYGLTSSFFRITIIADLLMRLTCKDTHIFMMSEDWFLKFNLVHHAQNYT